MKYCKNVLETIGNTPLIKLNNITKNIDGNIFLKLEYLSPGLSKKDKVAIQMIKDAENKGFLKKGQTIVELTSGNMGTGLAIACKLKGYEFIAVMSEGNSIERAKMMKAFGAKVVLVPQLPESIKGQVSGGDLQLVEEEAQRLTNKYNAFRADQFKNPSTYRAGELSTAKEIIDQLDGKIDVFTDFMGTGGSFIGISKAFKKYNKQVKCFGIEPNNAVKYGKPQSTGTFEHSIQGGGYMMDLPFINEETKNYIDGFISITDDEAIKHTRLLASEECIFAGISTGANLAAAVKLLKNEYSGKNIVIIAPDSGTKYLSSDLWQYK